MGSTAGAWLSVLVLAPGPAAPPDTGVVEREPWGDEEGDTALESEVAPEVASEASAPTTPPSVMGPVCDYMEFSIQIIEQGGDGVCRTGSAPVFDSEATLADLAEDLRRPGPLPPPWRDRVIQRIEETRNIARRTGEPAVARWADVGGPLPVVERCECAFVSGHPGEPNYECVRFQVQGAPALAEPSPACRQAFSAVWTLRSSDEAVLAYDALVAAQAAAKRGGANDREAVVARLQSARTKWKRFLERGYVQFPWELWLQSHGKITALRQCSTGERECGDEDLDPARTRVVFLHPVIGYGLQGLGIDPDPRSQGVVVLGVEAIGANHYSRDFRWFAGYAALVAFDNVDFADVRIGLAVHATRWATLGYTMAVTRRVQRGDGTLLFSLDFVGALARGLGYVGVDLDPAR